MPLQPQQHKGQVTQVSRQQQHQQNQQQITAVAADASWSMARDQPMRLDYRLEPELLFSGEESALLRLLQNYHSIGIQSSCKAAIYQVQYRESCCLAKRRVPCCDSCAVDSASVFSFLMCCWCFACDKATEVLQHHCLYWHHCPLHLDMLARAGFESCSACNFIGTLVPHCRSNINSEHFPQKHFLDDLGLNILLVFTIFPFFH